MRTFVYLASSSIWDRGIERALEVACIREGFVYS